MSIYLRRINNIIIFLFLGLVIKAQSNYTYTFNEYGFNTGLISSYCTFFYKDSRGFTWISSFEGLNKFDGQRVKVYKHNPLDSTTLLDNNIQSSFFENKNGDIWFTTEGAIHRYIRSEDKFQRIRIQYNNQYLSTDYYVFDLDSEGYLWIKIGAWNQNPVLYKLNTNSKNSKYDYERIGDFNGYRSVKTPIDSPKNTYSLYSFPSKTSTGFCEYLGEKSKNPKLAHKYFTGLPDDHFNIQLKVRSILTSDAAYLWLATESGLVRLNKTNLTYTIFNSYNNKILSPLTNAVEWKSDKIIVSAKDEGILFFDKVQQQFYHQVKQSNDNGLCTNNFNALHIDKDENLWMFSWTTSCVGHINLKKLRFPSLELPSGFKNNLFNRAQEDIYGNLWISDENGGVLLFNEKYELIKTFDANVFPEKKIKSIEKDDKGNIWFLTNSRLVVYKGASKSFETVIETKDKPAFSIKPIDRNTILMLGADAIYEVKEERNQFLVIKSKVISPQYGEAKFNDIFILKKNKALLLSHDYKLIICDISTKNWVFQDTLHVNGTVSSHIEVNDTVWLAGDKGLWKVFPTHNGRYDFKLELPISFVWSVELDKNNNFWLAAENGLYQYNRFSKNLKRFSPSDGVNNIMVLRLLKATNGDMWLAGLNRINVFKPEEIKDYDVRPQMQITGIKVNDEPFTEKGEVSELKEITLDYTHNTIDLEFIAIEYGDSKANKVKFRLDSYDKDSVWNEISNIKPSIKYFKLPPGTYTFRLKGYNSDGFECLEEKTLTITITPPWYRTWWGGTLISGSVATFIWLYFKRRERKIKEKAEFDQKILQTEMKALRAQMDPHFLFNTMNSINAFILQNDKVKASSFLTDFAHLIRKILDFSKEETISIEKEAEILRGYMQMEAMRFNNNFDYEIVIDDDLDSWDTQIPTMILQPFIENAIIHGIRNKKEGRGKISVRFEADGKDFFKCIVEDNGVGRQKAAEINKQTRPKTHNSKGMQITNDRIDILNYQNAQKTTLQIEDVKNTEGAESGTRVTVRVPFNL